MSNSCVSLAGQDSPHRLWWCKQVLGFLHLFFICAFSAHSFNQVYVYYYSGEDAYKKIRSGATLVQIYTALAYGGPALIPRIKVSIS
jgi:hypothetical protein